MNPAPGTAFAGGLAAFVTEDAAMSKLLVTDDPTGPEPQAPA